MISKEQKMRLGVFLVTSMVLLAIILAILIIPTLREKGDIYYINFKGHSVNGVNEGADVKYQGVKIGKVISLDVNPEDLDSILAYIRLKQGFPVKEDMRATLQYMGITGLRFVEISGGKTGSKFVPPGGEIKTKKGLGEKAEDIVLNVDSVVSAINELLKEENRKKIADMLSNFEKSSKVIANVLEKREAQVDSSLNKLDQTLSRLVVLVDNLNEFTGYINDLKNKGRIEDVIKDGQDLIKTVNQRLSKEELGQTLENLNNFLATATITLRKIENRVVDLEGEFSKTLSNMRVSIENIARFTRELTEDPTILLRKRATKRSK